MTYSADKFSTDLLLAQITGGPGLLIPNHLLIANHWSWQPVSYGKAETYVYHQSDTEGGRAGANRTTLGLRFSGRDTTGGCIDLELMGQVMDNCID